MELPQLTTERLMLRQFEAVDWPAVLSYTSNPEVMRFIPEGPFSQQQAQEFANRQAGPNPTAFAVVRRADARLLGHLLFHRWAEPRTYEIGWMFDPAFYGQGYATEAAQLLMSYGFAALDLHRIIATCQPENPASYRVMEKLGMRREGYFRQCIDRGNGVWWDEYMYAVLRSEWRGPRVLAVVEYNPAWPERFAQLAARIWPQICDLALSIEHVGSTSVPGLAAKPIIDMTIVVPGAAEVPLVIERLATLGYQHRGNLGIEERESFAAPTGLPSHHLYLCPQSSTALHNHLAVRDYLRQHPAMVQAYGQLKRQLAQQHRYDIDQYVAGKTDLLLSILQQQGFSSAQLELIEQANRGKG